MRSAIFRYIADPEPCVSSGDSLNFTQLYQHYPILSPFYFDFEKNFRARPYVQFARDTWPCLPILFIWLYVCMITFVPKVMLYRKPFELKNSLALWNLCLCLFSFFGMIRTVPQLFHNLSVMSFRDTICKKPEITYGEGACGLWSLLFCFSKVPELVDTAFIVLRKSKLIFLHWYHHITVLLFCWFSYAYTSTYGLYFMSMNYTVHAGMYGYYFLKSIDMWPKIVPAQIITVAQISQMFMGIVVCIMSYLYYKDDEPCEVHTDNLIAAGLLYGSYLYLFSEFFVKRFIFGQKITKKDL